MNLFSNGTALKERNSSKCVCARMGGGGGGGVGDRDGKTVGFTFHSHRKLKMHVQFNLY